MKNLKYILFSVLIAILFFTTCTKDKSEKEQTLNNDCLEDFNEYITNLAKNDSISPDSAKKIICDYLNRIKSEVTPFKIADTIVKRAKYNISLKGEQIEMRNVKIDVNELLSSIFPGYDTIDYENYGMRIYPGLIANGNILTYIICTSTNYKPDLECNYYYVDTTGKLISTDTSVANKLRRSFKGEIYLAGNPQDTAKPNYKTSRYYDWLSIKSYLSANGYNKQNNFKLKFSYGYVDLEIAQKLYELYWDRVADKAEDLQGFTTVLELYKDNATVVNRYAPGHTNFKGGILEIGNPCPPRCKGEGLISNY